jgi:hypothetical protein
MAFDLQNDELGDFDEFEFPPLDASPPNRAFKPIGNFCRLLALCVGAAVCFCAWINSPPVWLQPTIVGMLWASLFLVGVAAGSVRRGSLWFALVAGCFVWLSQLALQSLTGLVASECGLLVVCSFSAGWLVTQFEFSGRSRPTSVTAVQRYQQWTIWDLALLTMLVAVMCYALPRLESPWILLAQVGFVLLGGCICSWMAYRWVFDDCWTLTKLMVMIVGSSLCLWLFCIWVVSQQPSNELSLQLIAAWMLTGPIAVMAAQGFTVLAILTAIRVDQGSLTTTKPLDTGRSSETTVEGLRIYSN